MKLRVFVVLAARCLWAQQPTAAVSHESVIVTGSAEPIPLEEADRDVSVLPLPPRQRPLFDSWFQLLQTDPGLDVQQRSPGGFIADLSIRGATFGQTLVLLNGMRMSDAQTGHFNLDLPVPIDVISGVEAMKGSGSALYGSDAIGGVINVRTEPFETPDLRLLAGVGNFGTNEEHGVASFRRARASEQLAFARDFSFRFHHRSRLPESGAQLTDQPELETRSGEPAARVERPALWRGPVLRELSLLGANQDLVCLRASKSRKTDRSELCIPAPYGLVCAVSG